jgi:hypothetical protein
MEVVEECGIERTPLSPYFYKEMFISYPLVVDVSKLRATGFQWRRPRLTPEAMREFINEFTLQGMWPLATGPLPSTQESDE